VFTYGCEALSLTLGEEHRLTVIEKGHLGKCGIVGPANQGGCIIRCVGNLADEKL
jgi:hypothetical protein